MTGYVAAIATRRPTSRRFPMTSYVAAIATRRYRLISDFASSAKEAMVQWIDRV